MTTFIDFRYSRALTAALFAGQEKEETEIVFAVDRDGYVALDIGSDRTPRPLATFVDRDGSAMGILAMEASGLVSWRDRAGAHLITTSDPSSSGIVGLLVGSDRCGIRVDTTTTEARCSLFTPTAATTRHGSTLRLECAPDVTVMGRGSGRASRWAQLFYHRPIPAGLCVNLTMDWHHLRAGIPLFGTMTAEELVEAGTYRLRFHSYAHDTADAQATDFVRLFGSDATPDIAVHLSPALYLRPAVGVPNVAYTVTESERVQQSLVARCNSIDRTCVPSTFVRDIFRRAGVTRALEVVHHGVDSAYFRPGANKEPLPGGRSFNFLAIGTHVERKNIKHIVRAFLEEFREHEDVALFLLLRPEYLSTQNNVALAFTDWERTWGRNSAPIRFWTGYVTREHLRDFYANANAYVMPSNEGFGLTLLEAMACGTPTIALKRGGVLDFVTDDNGILVPVGKSYVAQDVDTLPYVGDVFYQPDIRRLRQAMRRLFEDQSLTKRLGERARADAEKLNWRVVSQQFVRCIEQTYAESRRDGRPAAGAPVENGDRPASAKARLTIGLCVLDDADASASIEHLRQVAADDADVRVVCLFTRYARLADIVRARECGFNYYRWDGTIENSKIITRSLVGPGWMAVLKTGEQLTGDRNQLTAFLASLPADVGQVSMSIDSGQCEPRLFHLRSEEGVSGQAHYAGATIRSAR